jgi:outer membrane receptor protein involved in Fe transport
MSGYAPADFILGLPQSVTTPGPEVRGRMAAWRDGFFVNDTWQLSRRLTVNLGLRYELPTVPYTATGFATILNEAQTAILPANPPLPGFKLLLYPNHTDFAPRVGLAYKRPTG